MEVDLNESNPNFWFCQILIVKKYIFKNDRKMTRVTFKPSQTFTSACKTANFYYNGILFFGERYFTRFRWGCWYFLHHKADCLLLIPTLYMKSKLIEKHEIFVHQSYLDFEHLQRFVPKIYPDSIENFYLRLELIHRFLHVFVEEENVHFHSVKFPFYLNSS